MTKVSKKALIITDGTDSIQSIASVITRSLKGFKVKVCSAAEFEGTDLLPVDTFFLGCEKANPSSFAYLEDMLSHINLVSRKCGIFSSEEKALKYLIKIVKDCEADLADVMLVKLKENFAPAIEDWVKEFFIK